MKAVPLNPSPMSQPVNVIIAAGVSRNSWTPKYVSPSPGWNHGIPGEFMDTQV